MSKRHAEKLKKQKENELAEHPGRRNVNRACSLSNFLQQYLTARKSELALGTLLLHEQTARYLLAYFGAERRIDQISRADARGFKTALADNRFKSASKTGRAMGPVTVDMHIRNSRAIFNHAVNDDIILFNPFDRLSSTAKAERAWHYVSQDEYEKLIESAPNVNWRLLIALCRLAGLRRGEALNLEWSDIDWERTLIRVVAKENWQPKDKDSRRVPICPELQRLLLDAYNHAKPGQRHIIEGIAVMNLWRDFNVLRQRAGVDPYSKPFHTLRKSCITDWAASYPAHVVKEWAGHSSLDTTDRYYLRVPESEYERAASNKFWHKTTQVVSTFIS
ncbi:MAG: tyrosine-type recombinase/integrase [Planctomycetota bacterium]